MATQSQPIAGANYGAMQCMCGVTWDQHRGLDHNFVLRPAYDPATWKRGARFEHEDLNPATNLYITVEDRLRVAFLSQQAGVVVNVVLRLQRPDGQVIPLQYQITPASNATVQNSDFDLCEGFLLDCSVSTTTAGVRVGSVFAIVQVIRGSGANALPSRTLISNYVSTGNVIGWPEGPNQQSVQGSGFPNKLLAGNPAAGADISQSVTTFQRWLLQAFTAQLTTSAAVANRNVHIQITDGTGNVFWDCAASAVQAASTTVRYSACGGVQPTFADASAIISLPDVMLLQQGWQIKTVTTLIQAGDQWANPNFNFIQYVEP